MPSPTFRGVKAVFFDVDDTLYDFEHSMLLAFEHLRRAFPDVLGHHEVERMSEAYWRHYRAYDEEAKVDLMNRDPDLFRRIMWAGALAGLGLDEDERARAWLRAQHPTLRGFSEPEGFARVLTEEFQKHRPAHWRAAMYAGARDLLLDLKPRVTLGAITNGPTAVQRPKLEALAYRDFFEEHRVLVSGEFGLRKPHASIFLAAAKSAGAAPEECVMVGDAREYDMPARAVGFRTILFCGPRGVPDDLAKDEWPPDAVASTYDDVRALLL